MPDKQNDNRFMAMLERKGIVRKSGAEDEPAGADPAATRQNAEADLRSLLNPTDGEATKVTPAARQPIPGLSTPIFPGEKPQQDAREPGAAPVGKAVPIHQDIQAERLERERSASSAASGSEPPKQAEASTQAGAPKQPEPSRPAIAPEPIKPPEPGEPSRPAEPRRQPEPQRQGWASGTGNITGIDPFKDISATGNAPPAEQAAPAVTNPQAQPATQAPPTPLERAPEPPTVDSYTDRYLDIEELYEVLSLRTKRTDTVYLIEEYLKTLPDSLPDQSRREIVGKIVAASGFDYDFLMGDGVLRVKSLKDYAERFARYTDGYIAARNAELNELEQQILRIRRLIENRRDLHKQQFFVIEAEAQRLKEILTFISG